jgi:hypothetical protein
MVATPVSISREGTQTDQAGTHRGTRLYNEDLRAARCTQLRLTVITQSLSGSVVLRRSGSSGW